MSFPRYPTYKDSGVEWLGAVPGHWFVTKTKHVVDFTTGWTPPTGDSAAYDGTHLWANISDLGPKYLFDTSKRVSDDAITASRIRVSPKGSLLFSFKLSIGQVSFAGQDMFTNEAIATFLPSPKLSLEYAYYAFPILLVQNAAENIYGAKLLNQDLIRSASFALPSPSEQKQIAAFLDRETAKIDVLVAEQRRLMDLLKEKRHAVISHAVTRGLNPDAPMKPSGIKWLGNVPAHWEVVPLKHLCDLLRDGTHLPPERVDSGIPLLSVRNLVNGEFVLRSDDSFISEESYQALCRAFVPQEQDVLLAIVGATLGKSAIVPSCLGPFHIQRSVAIFRTRMKVVQPKFLHLVFQSSSFQSLLWEMVGYSAQPGIYLGTLENVRIAVPPVAEQAQVLGSISVVLGELVDLTAEAQRAIDLLQERRSALISAAVTGQIDARSMTQSL